MNDDYKNASFWLIALCIVGFALFVQALTGGGSSSSSVSSAPVSTSVERTYVERRFKQEGFSNSDAATAADAVLKFQRAQDARRSR